MAADANRKPAPGELLAEPDDDPLSIAGFKAEAQAQGAHQAAPTSLDDTTVLGNVMSRVKPIEMHLSGPAPCDRPSPRLARGRATGSFSIAGRYSGVAPHHVHELEASAVEPHVLQARAYTSIPREHDAEAWLRSAGFSSQVTGARLPGLVLPLWGVDGRRWGWRVQA